MVQTPKILSGDLLRASRRLILSYVLDWVVIIAGIGIGAGWSKITPNKRPFSLVDSSISFPYVTKPKISSAVLIVLSLIVPGIIIPIVTLLLVPGPTIPKGTPKSLIWRRKIWEWHTGWMGLGLSLAAAMLLTDGMKNLFGKPRPDMLSRCQPDVANLQDYVVSGYEIGNGFLVSAAICQNTDTGTLNDGFRSFPSGHASYSWALLTYLTLFLCSKFAITIPFLAPRPFVPETSSPPQPYPPTHSHSSKASSPTIPTPIDTPPNHANLEPRNQSAAPPLHLLILAFFPLALATYISSTRYSDFRHHGFDILFGAIMGFLIGWFSFRWYHLPVRQGAGWAWGARSKFRAFGVGVGVGSYVGSEGWGGERGRGGDLEDGSGRGRDLEVGRGGLERDGDGQGDIPLEERNGNL
ncbi:MAG: hypothetical protein M1812_005354 [Candelaria pacifica]|nr:MAG: hypothetical protein M1812_005354 [Candelaria pacifica]